MKQTSLLRTGASALLLVLAVFWALVSAKAPAAEDYPNGQFLVSAQWLNSHLNDENLVIVDVREKKYLKDAFIPGAVHLEWKLFQETDMARGLGGIFVGVDRAQELLGQSGITPRDTVVLYDAEKRDGAATASYVFWVLDVLGHGDVRVLVRGFEAWTEAGFKTSPTPAAPQPMLYQAPADKLRLDRWVTGSFIQARLGDLFYQILDVRSEPEYLGAAANKGLDGAPLKLGHIPTAYNVNYTLNWSDPQTKTIKSYSKLQDLYAGLDPDRAVITYCHSGRRGSFSYLVLRAMGFEHISLYEASWFEWGNPRFFFPVETQANALKGDRPGASAEIPARPGSTSPQSAQPAAGSKPAGGYISCGG
jgi:thiosulfate/3-mercaptopyruvate sulfurtransferase